MTPPGRLHIQLVLDTSAILEYAAGSLDVGETITQVAEEGASARFGLPVIGLIEAHQALANQTGAATVTMLAVLDAHRHSVVLALDTKHWDQLAKAAAALRSVSCAAALAAAEGFKAFLLSAEPDRYRVMFDGGLPSYIIGC